MFFLLLKFAFQLHIGRQVRRHLNLAITDQCEPSFAIPGQRDQTLIFPDSRDTSLAAPDHDQRHIGVKTSVFRNRCKQILAIQERRDFKKSSRP